MKEYIWCLPFDVNMSKEERDLLSTAYKNVIESRFNSHKLILKLELEYEHGPKRVIAGSCRIVIEKELKETCFEIIVRFVVEVHVALHTNSFLSYRTC